MTSRFAVLVCILLLIGAVPAGIAGAATSSAAVGPDPSEPAAVGSTGPSPSIATDSSGGSAATMADADDILHRTTELRHLPKRPGTFEAEMTFEIPAPMSGLEIDLESEADVEATDGFEATGEGTYRWTESTDEPSIRFTMPTDRRRAVDYQQRADGTASETAESVATETAAPVPAASGGRDGYTFVDTGDWGVVQVPGVGVSFQKPQGVSIGIEETVTVAGPGAAGDDIAFFGPVTEHQRTVDGKTIRLAVSDDADLHERPDDILDALTAASERLAVGASSNEVFVVAVPSDADWGPRGIQYGESDAWVVADAPLDEASNVWLHEYVHARQGFANPAVGTTTDAKWLVEAQAEYYAGLLAYEQGLISFSEFGQFLERGERSPYADGVLADPTTWADEDTDYVKGPLVYGELDRQLRLATDGDRTLDDVFRQLNARDERVSEGDFLEALEAAGGTSVRETAERYTRTDDTPDMWSRYRHDAAFDQPRATIEYGLGSGSIEVAGQPWERWNRDELGGASAEIGHGDVLAVPAGESVTVPIAIENVDERSGTADATLQVDGKIIALEQRALEAGERTTERLSWTPTKPGVYDVRVGTDRLTVFVRSTPSLTVTELALDPDSVEAGDPVTATATVRTSDQYPAAGTLEFRTAVGTATGGPIALAPGETGTVEAELTFDDDGSYEVTAGGQSATVSVGSILAKVESMPGFGVTAVAIALGLVLTVAMVGRRR